jgi:hypothetical protein
MAKQYRLERYNVSASAGHPPGEEVNERMGAMSEDGWGVHTADITWPEVAILWERDGESENGNENGADEAATEVDSGSAEPKAKSSPKSKAAASRGRRAGAPSG